MGEKLSPIGQLERELELLPDGPRVIRRVGDIILRRKPLTQRIEIYIEGAIGRIFGGPSAEQLALERAPNSLKAKWLANAGMENEDGYPRIADLVDDVLTHYEVHGQSSV